MQVSKISNNTQNFGKWERNNGIMLSRGVAVDLLNGNYKRAAKSLQMIDKLQNVDNFTFEFDMHPYGFDQSITATRDDGIKLVFKDGKNIFENLKNVQKTLKNVMKSSTPTRNLTPYYFTKMRSLIPVIKRIEADEFDTAPDKINQLAEHVESYINVPYTVFGEIES